MFSSILNYNKKFIYGNYKNNHFYISNIKTNLQKHVDDYKNIIKEGNNKFINKQLEKTENKIIKDNKLEIKKKDNLNLFLTLSISISIFLFSVKIFKR